MISTWAEIQSCATSIAVIPLWTPDQLHWGLLIANVNLVVDILSPYGPQNKTFTNRKLHTVFIGASIFTKHKFTWLLKVKLPCLPFLCQIIQLGAASTTIRNFSPDDAWRDVECLLDAGLLCSLAIYNFNRSRSQVVARVNLDMLQLETSVLFINWLFWMHHKSLYMHHSVRLGFHCEQTVCKGFVIIFIKWVWVRHSKPIRLLSRNRLFQAVEHFFVIKMNEFHRNRGSVDVESFIWWAYIPVVDLFVPFYWFSNGRMIQMAIEILHSDFINPVCI